MGQTGYLQRTIYVDKIEVAYQHSDVEAAADGHELQPGGNAPRSAWDDQQQLALLVH